MLRVNSRIYGYRTHLGIALTHRERPASVRGVRTRVVLDVARTLKSGAETHKVVATTDNESTTTSCHGRRNITAKIADKSLQCRVSVIVS